MIVCERTAAWERKAEIKEKQGVNQVACSKVGAWHGRRLLGRSLLLERKTERAPEQQKVWTGIVKSMYGIC